MQPPIVKDRPLLAYWILFSYFAAGAMLAGGSRPAGPRAATPLLALGVLLVIVLVGFRFEVGGDWENYQFLFSYMRFTDLGEALAIGDPAYQFLNWTAQRIGAEIWLVNLVCGAIFGWGLFRLAKSQPNPWLALVVAIPYVVVVVAMGYTRQAVAIGIIMAGLASMQRSGSVLRFSLYVAAATLFHRTAIAVLPVVIFASERNRILNAIAGVAMFFLLYDLFLADSVDEFVSNYIEAEYSSEGAAIRVVMNLVPATLFLLQAKRFGFPSREEKIWRYFSIAAWLFLGLLLVLPSSTVVDRLALYITPLQIVILSRLPGAYSMSGPGRLAVVGYSAAVLFVWLNYASHAEYWLPYQFHPL